MAKYRPIDVRLWHDRKFLSLSDDARLLWVFLLTAPNTLPIPGVIVAGEASIAEQLGWTQDRVRKLFAELFAKQLSVRCEGRLLWLPNALKYQAPRNPNMVKCWAENWDDIPECTLKVEIWQALKIACKSWSGLFGKLFREPFAEQFAKQEAKQLSQKQDQKQDQDQKDIGGPSAAPSSLEIFKEKVNAATGEIGKQRAAKPRPATNPDHQRTIDAFHQRFKTAYGEKPTWTGREIGMLSDLLKRHDADVLISRMDVMFSGRIKWPPPPYTLKVFVGHIDAWVETEAPTQTTFRVVKEIA